MKKKFISTIIAILALFLFVNCGKELTRQERILKKSEDEKVKLLLDKLLEINNHSPESLSADFTIEGKLHNKKKFKSLGKVVYNKKPRKMKVSFIDFVFKSPITTIVQDGKVLKFYLPVEKKLYLDNIDTINLKNYINIDLDFNFIYRFIICEIPLIENYHIKQGLIAKLNGEREGEEVYIILENNEFFETISFKKSIPNKVLLINKITKERSEFYLEKPSCENNMLRYRAIKFISQNKGHRVIVRFNRVRFNLPINLRTITRVKLSKRMRVIRVK